MDELAQQADMLAQYAGGRGLTISRSPFDFDLVRVPTARFDEWGSFVDLAAQSGAQIVYLSTEQGDIELALQGAAKEAGLLTAIDLDDQGEPTIFADPEDDDLPTYRQRQKWVAERLIEISETFRPRRTEAVTLRALWMRDGVAHYYSRQAEWWTDFSAEIAKEIDQLAEVKEEARIAWSNEDAVNTLELANVLARHERFPEANNESKREYMATQLFPDREFYLRSIIALAQAIYWWDVEPMEKVGKVERARALREEGYSVPNIAAMLKMSPPKVRAALAD